MPSAVYYPHTALRDDGLLRTSLLLWDRVDVIVPSPSFSLTDGFAGRRAEARELLLRARVPTPTEQSAVHKRIDDLIRDGVPHWLLQRFNQHNRRTRGIPSQPLPDAYLIYPQKLAHMTWLRLQEAGLARWDVGGDAAVPPALGYLLMSFLADACAGQRLHRITDRMDAYGDIFGLVTQSLGGTVVTGKEVATLTPAIERLLSRPINS